MKLKELALVVCKANQIEVRTYSYNFSITFKNDDEMWEHIRKEEAFGEKEVAFIEMRSPHSSKMTITLL